MKKKMTAMLLAVAMMLGMFTFPAYATNQKFNDVPDSHWAHSYIQSAAADGVMNGTGEGNFSPAKTLTRAEFIVMMMRAFYPNDIAPKEAELKDKGIEVTWFTAHCALAYDKKLFLNSDCSAVGDSVMKLYRPDSSLYQLADDLSVSSAVTISRVDMAVIASNIMLDKGVPKLSDADTDATLKAIPDISAIPYGRQVVMAIAYHYGVITGIDAAGTFNPNGTVDRASAAAIYCRLRDAIRDYAGDTTPAPTPTPTPTPSVEPTPAPSAPPVTIGTKAPYATTEDSIVGTISDSRVTLDMDTHRAPVDYWSKHPELNGLTDKDAYNAYVFTALNREWIYENGIVASVWKDGAWTDGVDTFNYPCFDKNISRVFWRRIPFTDYNIFGVASGTIGNMEIKRVGDVTSNNIDVYAVEKIPDIKDMYNGNLEPIFAKFTPNMTDKEKIVIMVEALCEKMTYSDGSPEVADIPRVGGPDVWASDAPVVKGICDDYAVAFDQICCTAGIPSMICGGAYPDGITKHAWNLVYADGQWLVVDPSGLDVMVDSGMSFETARNNPDTYIFSTEQNYSSTGLKDDKTNEKLIIEALYKDVFGK